jgi:hypothetical protein
MFCIGWLLQLSLYLLRHELLKGREQLTFIDHAIVVGVDGSDGFFGLLDPNGGITVHIFVEIIEETGHFLGVEDSIFVSIVLLENRIDVVLEHLLLERVQADLVLHLVCYFILIKWKNRRIGRLTRSVMAETTRVRYYILVLNLTYTDIPSMVDIDI